MYLSKLDVDHVTASYDGVVAVRDASLRLPTGQVTALIGPNGSGKSTLLRTMAGLHPADSGEIKIGTRHLSALRPKEAAREITLLSQQRPTPLGATVGDVVAYGRFPHKHRWTGRDEAGPDAVADALAMTGLSELAQRPVDQLSGGQLQRVWLASCIAQATPVLLLDEPTNHLDLRYQTELLSLVRELARERSVAIGIVLHELNHAAAVADTVALMVDGQIAAYGDPLDVLEPGLLSSAYGVGIELIDDGCGRRRICALGSLRAPLPALAG